MKHQFVKIFAGFLAALLSSGVVSGQGWCGTVVTDEYVQFVRSQQLAARRLVIPQINKTLNITAWIVRDQAGMPSHDSAAIANAIAGLNAIYGRIGLSFVVCKFNYIENWQFNTWDQDVHDDAATILYYQPNTINIYFTGDIVNPAGAEGYAPLPPSEDFAVIKGLGSLAHELGHFFGLFHTFENQFGTEFADHSNSQTTGDLIQDTDADPGGDGQNVDLFCNYTPPTKDPQGDFYEPPTDNIMSYYGPCPCRFTPEQYLRMTQQFFLHRTNLW